MRNSEKIREALRAAGYNQRQVSVRKSHHGYDSSVTVEIKDPNVNVAQIEQIAESFEKVDRCAYTHEILAGGNVYVHVRVSDAVRAAWSAPYVEAAAAAMAQVPAEDNRHGYNVIVPGVEDGRFVIFRVWPNRDTFSVHYFAENQVSGSRIADQCSRPESIAFNIGEKMNALRNEPKSVGVAG